ncbi:MAG: hypothetical protein JWP25_1315 [Bradyrhizobium sp.]|nr:hypothetical protein [Bradyrhizobium sp.]
MIGAPDYASEFYAIERTVELVANEEVYRIEVMKHLVGAERFSTRAYKREDIVVQPAYPWSSAKDYERKPETVEIWKSIDIGWTDRDTADGALAQALGFLGERVRSAK